MSDIVERLRNLIEADDDPAMVRFYKDCLAEIERRDTAGADLSRQVMELRAENERLKADPDPGQRIWDDGYAAGKAAGGPTDPPQGALDPKKIGDGGVPAIPCHCRNTGTPP